jgi:lipid II:glycine glycyltransferase (peptidoglycan interpeptide bridge formation enzyme)
VSVFPAAIIYNDDKKILKSHPGSSYGGPVFNRKNDGVKIVIEVIDELLYHASEEGISSIEMRLSPRVFHVCPSEELEYVLWYRGFEVINTELSSAVQLMFETEKTLYDKFRYNTKQPAKKAIEAGVVFKETEDYDTFWKMLELNLTKHKATPTHTLEEMNRLLSIMPDKIKLFGAYYENKLIAGTLVFLCNEVTCHTFYIAQDYNFQKMRPLNVLLTETVQWARENGLRYLNFGISTEAGGTIVNPSLFRFKEGFAATGTVRRYYRKEILDDEI